MRILKVRFKNLNSLAGEWSLDFEHPEFQTNGLFLITGPTGAGKTTLLDAICLALYGRTPRIGKGGDLGEIMTRRAAECWAEATFETESGRYWARWEQKRARGDANGKLQPAGRRLMRENGDIKISGAQNVDQEVPKLTGLDFSQFTRAMLLAQGGFADFLKGSDETKSAILEKLTDTGIYSELSRLAHEREREEGRTLSALEEQREKLAPPTEEELEARRGELAARRGELEKLEKDLAVCGKGLTWLADLATLKKEASELEAQNHDLEVEIEEFEPRRQELENAKIASGFEGDYAALMELRRQKLDLIRSLEKAETDAAALRNLATEAQANTEAAHQKVSAKESELEGLLPILANARSLDTEIAQKKVTLAAREADVLTAQDQARNAAKLLADAEAEKNSLTSNLLKTETWLADNAASEWLLTNMGKLDEKFRTLKGMRLKVTAAEKQVVEAELNLKSTLAKIAANEKSLAQARQKAADCQRIVDDILERQRELLGGWTLPGLREALAEKREAQRAAAAIKSLEDHRKTLRPGTPCPLCGSLTHPYLDGKLPDPDLLEKGCVEIENQIRDIEKIGDKLAEVEKVRDKAILESCTLDEKAKDYGELQKANVATAGQCRDNSANLKREILEIETAIREEVQPLGITAIVNFDALPGVLRDRLSAWQKYSEIRKEQNDKLRGLETTIVALRVQVQHAAADQARVEEDANTAAAELAESEKNRMPLLNGENADTVESRVKSELAQIRKLAQKADNLLADRVKDLNTATGSATSLRAQITTLDPDLATREKDFSNALINSTLDENLFLGMRRDPETRRKLETASAALKEKKTALATRQTENARNLEREMARAITDKSVPELEEWEANLKERRHAALEEIAALKNELETYDKNRQLADELLAKIAAQSREYGKWRDLSALIGSADGKKFRSFAQNVTLDLLLKHANRQLVRITDRYALRRRPASGDRDARLDLEVVDNYEAGEIRSIKNLSGGEVFIASLALALGLSEMAARNATLGSLFVDEGFGTLDADTLETAIDAIASLRREGKLIGVISHVEALIDRIPTQIRVRPQGPGRGAISGPGCVKHS